MKMNGWIFFWTAETVIDHRSYTDNLSSCGMKLSKLCAEGRRSVFLSPQSKYIYYLYYVAGCVRLA